MPHTKDATEYRDDGKVLLGNEPPQHPVPVCAGDQHGQQNKTGCGVGSLHGVRYFTTMPLFAGVIRVSICLANPFCNTRGMGCSGQLEPVSDPGRQFESIRHIRTTRTPSCRHQVACAPGLLCGRKEGIWANAFRLFWTAMPERAGMPMRQGHRQQERMARETSHKWLKRHNQSSFRSQ